MNRHLKRVVYYGNKTLNQPLTIIVVLIALFTYFVVGNAQFQKQNRAILLDTHATVENSQTIIKNLQTAVKDLKEDNARQTRFIQCILALHGANVQIDADVQVQCTKMATAIDISNVTKPPSSEISAPQPTASSAPPSSGGSPTPPTASKSVVQSSLDAVSRDVVQPVTNLLKKIL